MLTRRWLCANWRTYLSRYYKKKTIILLDEYDTPMQEAHVNGYWEELVAFTRSLFNCTFKTNPYLERGVMTGITRVSRESIFSDLNNLVVVTTTSNEYADSFGFTQEEVFAALDEQGMQGKKADVKVWYDGFTFGDKTDIYNPWSIVNFLKRRQIGTYWANSSSNSLVGKLLREGNKNVKQGFQALLEAKGISKNQIRKYGFAFQGPDSTDLKGVILKSGKYLYHADKGRTNQNQRCP